MTGQPLFLSIVVATKDRPRELRRMFDSLLEQTRRPDEVIIVDGSDEPRPVREVTQGPYGFTVRYRRLRPPSASRQRNAGMAMVDPEATLIGFLDDDSVLTPRAVEKMAAFWDTADMTIAGASFNMANHPELDWGSLKKSWLARALSFYSSEPGDVTRAGFQTMIGNVRSLRFVRWLPSGAVIWRKEILRRHRFDEWYDGYSYLEDLDFSYGLGKSHRLAVVGGADYFHYPAGTGRSSWFVFGCREVLHRIYFVRKNPELSIPLCCFALGMRALLSVRMAWRERDWGYLARAAGNMVGFVRVLTDAGGRK